MQYLPDQNSCKLNNDLGRFIMFVNKFCIDNQQTPSERSHVQSQYHVLHQQRQFVSRINAINSNNKEI